MKKTLKNNYKFVLGIIVGAVIFGTTVYATTVLSSSDVSYSNTSSSLTATTVQGAIDEVYKKADIRKQGNFISAYTYNSSNCVTGEEDTCIKTDCYKNKTAGSCKAGDIIKYKVNDTDIVTFHVMFDNGNTLTMQSQKNTINNTSWYGTSSSYINTNGPLTILPILETATSGWTNVNSQNYTMGTTSLSNKGEFTGCSDYNSCTKNTYTLESRTARARMITLQAAVALGCTQNAKSCPKWMYNYLYNSTSYGETVNDNTTNPSTGGYNYGYWTMNALSSSASYAWEVNYGGSMNYINTFITDCGARAVIVINKNLLNLIIILKKTY